MGITARGAWESVKRHFRELGHEHPGRRTSPSSASATCRATCSATGCCSRGTSSWSRAFNHLHVFLDPDPDPEASFAERKRLFELPRSSWSDYDAAADLRGRRRLSSAPRSRSRSPTQVKEALGDRGRRAVARRADPRDPARAAVDLLWNGGIGTYVKASTETHADAGDKANDARPRRRQRTALPGRRRGRQPRVHPARADRVRARRRSDQHRRDRQRRRRQLLRPRGQHQDPARRARRRRRHDREAAQRAARRDDRRGRRAGPLRQLHADPGDEPVARLRRRR